MLAVLIGLAVLGGIGYGGWWWLSDTLEDDEAAADDPLSTAIEDYVTAWEEGDGLAMASMVRGEAPEDFEDRHAQMIEGLQADDLTITVGEVDDAVEGRAVVPLTLDLEVPIATEPISWDVELRWIRDRGVWEVEWSLSTLHPEMRPTWRFDSEIADVDRAPILATDGTELAGDGALVDLGFEPGRVLDEDRVIRAFEEALPGTEERVERELNRDDLVSDWFYPIARVSPARADEAWPLLRGVPGILPPRPVRGQARALLDEGFAQHVVGIVDEATAEQLEELGDDYEPGDVVGRYGLEQVYEDQLVGGRIYRGGLRERDDGEFNLLLGEGQEEGAGPIQTTLDVAVQRAAENALADVELPAAIVVVDGTDGAIRAAASRPLTGWNRAFEGRYPPGSTFKLVTAEALLATGMAPDDEVTCPAETSVGGLRVPNAGGRELGDTTFEMAFAESCNTTFATLAAQLGGEPLSEAAERFGFDVEPLVPLAAFGGSFPEPGDSAEVGAASFGQARVEASVLHMASVGAAVVSGVWHQPYLIADDGPGESRSLATGTPEPLRRIMLAGVDAGTGSAAQVDGQQVGGKTGTAQTHDGLEHAWFLGTWGDYGFAILIEDGGAGSETAAPIAGRFVAELVALLDGQEDPLEPTDGLDEDVAGTDEDELEPEPLDDDQDEQEGD